ncbi:MAG: hypothetical protein U1F43_19905 [Myxococcota bacterium]
MRKGTIAVGAILVGGLIGLVAVLASGGDAPASDDPDLPDPMAIRTAHLEDGATPRADDHRPRRKLEVAVTGCHGMPVEGAVVVAEAGGERLSAKSDADGYARLRVLLGQTKVVARLSTLESESMPTESGTVEVDLCPGASLHGQVIDAWGSPQPGVTLALVDDAGEALEEVESDVDGGYLLNDLALDAAAVLVEGELRPLRPLTPREDRQMDVLVGATRKVRGFVLDLAGDPVPGVLVTLRPMAFDGVGWSAVTDQGGGFAIVGPITAGRVDADGGDLGKDRAWVGEGADEKVVDLVLEPVGTITVVKPDATDKDAKVSIRCWDQKSMGDDQSWINGPSYATEAPVDLQAEYGEGPYPDDLEGEVADPVDEQVAPPPTPAPGPEAAMMARVLRRVVKELVPELEPDGGADLSPEEYVQRLQAKVESMTPEQQAALTKRVDESKIQKILAEEGMLNPDQAPVAAPAGESEGDDGEDIPELALDPAPSPEFDQGEGDYYTPNDDSTPELVPGADPAYETYDPNDGVDVGIGEGVVDYADDGSGGVVDYGYTPSELDKYATYVEGVLGEALSVPANQWYDIFVERADGTETQCGRVLVKAGEDVVVQCGGAPQDSTVEGRFVEKDGKPVANLEVWYNASNSSDSALYREGRMTTGPDGRFRFDLSHDKAVTVTIGVGSNDDQWTSSYGRRNVTLVPGEDKDVGDLLWVPEGQRPESWPTTAYGGIGGLITLDDNGVTILDMEPESPLAMAGVDKDDTIVLIDGVPAAELPQDEVFMRLRGDPGTAVDLRFRSAVGELYEVTLERKLMDAPDGTWGGADGGGDVLDEAPEPAPIIDF